jgi:hypothetical protein
MARAPAAAFAPAKPLVTVELMRISSCFFAGLVLAVLASDPVPARAETHAEVGGESNAKAPSHPGVRFADDKLSVDFESVPAKQALQAIGKAANVEIRAPESILAKKVTAKFEALPLERGIRRIARSLEVANSAVIYEGGRQVFVMLEKGQSLPVTATSPPTSPAAGATLRTGQPKAKLAPEERRQMKEERAARREQTRAQRLEDKIKTLEKSGNTRRAARLKERLTKGPTKQAAGTPTPTLSQ